MLIQERIERVVNFLSCNNILSYSYGYTNRDSQQSCPREIRLTEKESEEMYHSVMGHAGVLATHSIRRDNTTFHFWNHVLRGLFAKLMD